MVKAVFLDVGGTIFHPGEPPYQVYRDILRQHGYDAAPDEARAWLDSARRDARADGFGPAEDFSISDTRQQAYRARMVGLFLQQARVAGEAFDACFSAIQQSWVGTRIFHCYPDARKVLPLLKEAGLLVAAVSNWESRLDDLLASHGLHQYFDLVLSSESVGYAKPSPRLYELALERTGLQAEDVLHVGDQPEEDVRVAEALGIRTAYLQRRPDRPLNHAPRIRSLEAVVPLATANALLRGRVETGQGQAALYTELDWVRRQVAERLGFDHMPGTLNLRLDDWRDLADWQRLRSEAGVPLEPTAGYCAARCYPAWAEGSVPCAIVHPLLNDYPESLVEVIAPVSLRATLGLRDGAWMSLAVLHVPE